jgi:hypothetical protein
MRTNDDSIAILILLGSYVPWAELPIIGSTNIVSSAIVPEKNIKNLYDFRFFLNWN